MIDKIQAVILARSYLNAAAQKGLLEPSTESHIRVLRECGYDDLLGRVLIEGDWLAFDALTEKVASDLEAGATLPPRAAEWAALRLRGQHVRPKTSGRYKGANFLPEYIISEAVDLIIEATPFDVIDQDRPGRRLKVDEGQVCACEIVATAMRELGRKPATSRKVKESWEKRSLK